MGIYLIQLLKDMVSISSKSEVFEFSAGWWEAQKPPLRGLHVTCDAHFRTSMSYFSQKSCVKIWSELVESFKSYRGNKQTTKIKIKMI